MSAVYLDHMGNDLSVVNDARVSFSMESSAVGSTTVQLDDKTIHVPTLSKADQGLINYLARGCSSKDWNAAIETLLGAGTDRVEAERIVQWARRMPTHWTPFGHQILKFRMKAPVPVRTQCYKSKIGMVENEESRRYIKSTPEIFMPGYRSAPEGSIKQGSGGPHPNAGFWLAQYKAHAEAGVQLYLDQIEAGIAPEQARFSLPQGVYVNWVWTGSLYAYAEFFNKRSDRGHAQAEIADLADLIGEQVKQLFPVSWAALTNTANHGESHE